MNKLFKLIIFFVVEHPIISPKYFKTESKKRKRKKREKSKVERVIEDDSQPDSLTVSKLVQENAKNT